VRVGGRTLTNHNKLLWRVDGADGVKTGYTKAAGRILVSSASRDGRRLICVTINDGNDWADHAALLEQGFSRYHVRSIVSKGDVLETIRVLSGENQEVSLLAQEDFSFSLADEEVPRVVYTGPGFAYAPVVKGEEAGYAYVCIGEEVIGKIPLVYGQTVEMEKETNKPFWKRWLP